jgi:hypothetical protein
MVALRDAKENLVTYRDDPFVIGKVNAKHKFLDSVPRTAPHHTTHVNLAVRQMVAHCRDFFVGQFICSAFRNRQGNNALLQSNAQ